MKKIAFLLFLFSGLHGFGQELAFPFQGGSRVMAQFFKDSLVVSRDIRRARASGMVVFKFSADEKGFIRNLVVYYADDAMLAVPAVQALKKSAQKWIIPDNEKLHDFILPFSIRFQASESNSRETAEAAQDFYMRRRPIVSHDQIPLNQATLLPPVVITYSIP